jgi:selenide, water dikinase
MIDLLTLVESGGCSSKLSPGDLEALLAVLPKHTNPDILIGYDTGDDAAIYRLDAERSLILTTDFFPPVCSDPYDFGQIAAANSLSDVYAMGGTALAALNIMMFPSRTLPLEVYREILRGGAEKALEARCPIVGGHTIEDTLPKYGLAVTGIIETRHVTANRSVRRGDIMILTKPIGTGIVIAGKKAGLASGNEYHAAVSSMKTLNDSAARIMNEFGVSAATDITGFGLAGHALKLARHSDVRIRFSTGNLPLLPGAFRLAESGCIPCGVFKNEDYTGDTTVFPDTFELKALTLDPQTSGGLLMACPEHTATQVVKRLIEAGYTATAVIGEALAAETDAPLLEFR